MANCTNTVAQPALHSQSVRVILSGAQALSILPLLEEGQACLSESSGAIGYIDQIDLLGHSFRVAPKYPNTQFNSGETNTLAVNELITVTV